MENYYDTDIRVVDVLPVLLHQDGRVEFTYCYSVINPFSINYCVLQNKNAEYCNHSWRCNFTWSGGHGSLAGPKPALDIAGFVA